MTTLVGPQRRLTYKDLAQRWGMSIFTVYRWTKGLPRLAFSKRSVQFDEIVIEGFEARHTVNVPSRRTRAKRI